MFSELCLAAYILDLMKFTHPNHKLRSGRVKILPWDFGLGRRELSWRSFSQK